MTIIKDHVTCRETFRLASLGTVTLIILVWLGYVTWRSGVFSMSYKLSPSLVGAALAKVALRGFKIPRDMYDWYCASLLCISTTSGNSSLRKSCDRLLTILFESAKLRALRANVFCVITCSHALRAHVLTYLTCSSANVPLRAYVLMCYNCKYQK